MTQLVIGVLALQGAFARHMAMVGRVGALAKQVRTPQDLAGCHGLILPGGESTVIAGLIKQGGLDTALLEFAKSRPLFGTCAGAILMASDIISSPVPSLGLIDIAIERNAYGRQNSSFFSSIEIDAPEGEVSWPQTIPAFFIRAPRIISCSPSVTVLGHYEGSPVLVQQGYHLAATFHPELTDSQTVHRYFHALCLNAMNEIKPE